GSDKQIWLSQAIVILTVLGPIVSQATDYWGRKWFLVVLTSCAVIGSIVLSRATSMGMAIAGQVICSLSYGAQPLYYVVASEILPRKVRPAAQGGINAALDLGAITALLGGLQIIKTYSEGFRIFWYTNAAISAVAALILAVIILIHGSMPFLVGATFLTGLAVHQIWFKKDGLVHHGLFTKDRNFALALFVIFVEGMVFYCPTVYYPFQVSVLYETDPVRVGLRFSVTFFSAIVSSIAIAVYSYIRKTVRAPIVVSFLCFTIFFGSMASTGSSSSKAIWGYSAFLGTGIGLCLTCLVTVAQLSAPPALIAITSGLLIAIRSFGATIALSIKLLAQFIGALAGQDIAALQHIPDVTPAIIQAGVGGLGEAYTKAFRGVWIFGAVLSFAAAIVALYFVEPNNMTMHVDAPLDRTEWDATNSGK
ncbi:hypothetical protein IFR05_002971, partial [Cadophora sp. M221]